MTLDVFRESYKSKLTGRNKQERIPRIPSPLSPMFTNERSNQPQNPNLPPPLMQIHAQLLTFAPPSTFSLDVRGGKPRQGWRGEREREREANRRRRETTSSLLLSPQTFVPRNRIRETCSEIKIGGISSVGSQSFRQFDSLRSSTRSTFVKIFNFSLVKNRLDFKAFQRWKRE